MTDNRTRSDRQTTSTAALVSRRRVLRATVTTGMLDLGTVAAADSTAQQGGVAYLKRDHLRGRNNPDESRFKIVALCGTITAAFACDSGTERTYATYRIRCPNYPGGGGGEGDSGGHGGEPGHGDHQESTGGVNTAQHDDGDTDHGDCPGGGGDGHGGACGRHVLVNPNRRLDASLTRLYEFTAVRPCGESGYVKAAFRPAVE